MPPGRKHLVEHARYGVLVTDIRLNNHVRLAEPPVAGSFLRLTQRLLGGIVRSAEVDGDRSAFPGEPDGNGRTSPHDAPVIRA